MAPLMFRVGSPMAIKELREDLRLHLALGYPLVALLVCGVVFRVGIDRRQEHDVLPIGRPDSAVGARGNVRDLMRLTVESAAFGSEIAHPDLRRIGRLRSPDEPFAVG